MVVALLPTLAHQISQEKMMFGSVLSTLAEDRNGKTSK